jgi:hypothetical protein
MSAAADGAGSPFLSTHAFEPDIPPSIADGVAHLLAQDRQIIVVTGRVDGRMAGFLADLSHGIARQGSLLRIKAPLRADEFHAALAAQLKLPTAGRTAGELAAQVGQRLQQAAPKGRYILLCEAADRYEPATLEAIRQISNHPVSIVLVGGHALTQRLQRRGLAPLRQRVTHRLALNRRLPSSSFWLALVVLLGGGAALILQLLPERRPDEAGAPRPISVRLAAPPPVQPLPAAVLPAEQADLQLLLERDLAHAPAPARP